MSFIPHIQIQTTPLTMEYQTKQATLDVQPSKVISNYEIDSLKLNVDVVSPGRFEIDQEKAWEASGLGGNEFFTNQVYSESKKIVLQAIARMVEEGNRMAQVTKGTVIHTFHQGKPLEEIPFNYTGPASSGNVKFQVDRKEIQVSIIPGKLEIDTEITEPQYQYTPAVFDAYLKQQNSVTITPPVIDTKY